MTEPATTAVPAPPTQSKKPDETSAFKQQRMAAWQPVMSPNFVIGCFMIITLIFIPIGVVVIVASDSIIEVTQRYDQLAPSSCSPCNFSFTIDVPKQMDPPIYMYYQLENFYQNHRRYAKSRSDPQLSGDVGASLTDCDPFTNPGQYLSIPDGLDPIKIAAGTLDSTGLPTTVNPKDVNYLPCGLIAWSKFNDSFALYQNSPPTSLICDGGLFDAVGNAIGTGPGSCTKKGIAWPSDPGTKFVAPPSPYVLGAGKPSYLGAGGWKKMVSVNTSEPYCYSECAYNGWYLGERGHAIPDPMDEDLMVWMRVASLSNFRKLYRKVTTTIPKGTHTVNVVFNFPVSSFKGKKTFVLTTTAWIGGPNYVLGGLYIATGVLSFILGVAFFFTKWNTARRVAL